VVFDKFHVLQHASAALDDVRRQEFFRAGPVIRGTRTRETLTAPAALEDGSRIEARGTPDGVAANRRRFKVYVLREQLDRLSTYKTRPGVLSVVLGWTVPYGGNDCPKWNACETSSSTISRGSPPTAVIPYGFGFVESINTSIKAVLRRARGMRDEQMLLLKLKRTTSPNSVLS
jgi:transposase